ncbi:unnamed protein product [Plutella xylostella]|uniref:(diamondback moth) hypothetical protein n=1 Tax=Plutella xylostella TaxID=51655 RepID=A0A8S4FP34_PLUXY|nr:unnamed protein product [Plutella xylostella]
MEIRVRGIINSATGATPHACVLGFTWWWWCAVGFPRPGRGDATIPTLPASVGSHVMGLGARRPALHLLSSVAELVVRSHITIKMRIHYH